MMASRLMLSLKKAADKLGSSMRTEDAYAVTDVVFAGHRVTHVTMEYAMEAGLSRHDRDQTISLELENRP